jgi:hypothetical protein
MNRCMFSYRFSNTRERERVQRGGGSWAYNRLNSILEVSRAFGAYNLMRTCRSLPSAPPLPVTAAASTRI